MSVNIDEPRCKHEAGPIDELTAGLDVSLFDCRDPIAIDGDRADERIVTGAVDDGCIANHEPHNEEFRDFSPEMSDLRQSVRLEGNRDGPGDKDTTTMRYMLLIYSAEDAGPQPEDPDFPEHMELWFSYTNELEAAGALLGGEALQPSITATSVQVRDGETLTTDGPFAETKEVLGGYYLIDVPDLDAAREWAAKIPAAPYGTVEIRPIMELD